MIKCNKDELTVVGNRSEVAAEGVAILAYLHRQGMIVPCLKLYEKMLENGTIDKVFEESEG